MAKRKVKARKAKPAASVHFTMRVPSAVMRDLRRVAKSSKLTVAAVVVEVLKRSRLGDSPEAPQRVFTAALEVADVAEARAAS